MANNKIQIKRSTANATVTGLANGEQAFTQASNTLWIGLPDGSGVLRIGGAMVPGTLTANQALVANSTSGIDRVLAANVDVGVLNANGAAGSAGWVLFSGGGSSNTYWGSAGSVGVNVASQYAWTNTHSFSANVTLAGVIANGTIGTAGQTLTSNGSVVYWSTPAATGVTQVNTGVGMTGGPITTTGTVSVLPNNGIIANSTGVFVSGANGVSVTAAGVNVVGGDGLVSNTSGVHAVAGNGISVSADAITVTGGSTLTVNTTGVHVNSNLALADLTVSGNLTINGTLATIAATNLTVTDPLIKLANGNATTDTLDIGFFGVYGSSGAKYAGLHRDIDDGNFKLFTGLTVEPTTTVNTAAAGYTQATLVSYLNSGAFVANSTQVRITANSTVSSTITANTLTLTTALAGTSGGTGKATMTSQAILVGNTTNGFSELALGTSGYVLQSNGSALVYDTLDGGTF